MSVHMGILKARALKLGASDLYISPRKNKRFRVIYNDKIIDFGYKYGLIYYDHGDQVKRRAWLARHSKIKNKDGNVLLPEYHTIYAI